MVSKASKVHILKGKRWWFSREFQREALSTVRNRVPSGSTLWPSDRLWGNSSITFHGNKSSLLHGETIGTSKSRPKPAECSDLKAGKFTHTKNQFWKSQLFHQQKLYLKWINWSIGVLKFESILNHFSILYCWEAFWKITIFCVRTVSRARGIYMTFSKVIPLIYGHSVIKYWDFPERVPTV